MLHLSAVLTFMSPVTIPLRSISIVLYPHNPPPSLREDEPAGGSLMDELNEPAADLVSLPRTQTTHLALHQNLHRDPHHDPVSGTPT